MPQATISIRIWEQKHGKRLPDHYSDVAELFAPHILKVAADCRGWCHSGEICEDGFGGWWELKVEDTATLKAPAELLSASKRLVEAMRDRMRLHGEEFTGLTRHLKALEKAIAASKS